MKKHLYIFAILALGLLNSCGPVYVIHQDPPPSGPPPQETAPEPEPEVSYQSFYDQLSPYGQWIDDPGYGYVWMPNVGPEFKPYATNGHWVYTDEGWTWASNYNWGWATFHYGRWFYQDGYGWMWMPGNEWSPAWVTWRNSSDYYGWAPLAPNISLSISIGGGYNPPPHYWSFVPHQYVNSPQINNYYVNESRNVTIIHNTTVINNTTIVRNSSGPGRANEGRRGAYAGGPDLSEVGRFSGAPVRPVLLRRSNAPGEQMNNGQLAIYRPRVNQAPPPNANNGNGNGSSPRFAPSRVQTLNNARPVNTTRYNGNDRNGNDRNDRNPGDRNGNDRNGNDRNGNDRNGNDRNGNDRNEQPGTNTPPAQQPAVQPQPRVSPFRPRELPSQPAGALQPANNGQPGNAAPAGNGQPANNGQPAGNPNGNGQQPGDNRPRDNRPGDNRQPGGNGQSNGNGQPNGNPPPANNPSQPQPQPRVSPFRPRELPSQPANAVQPANNGQPNGNAAPAGNGQPPPRVVPFKPRTANNQPAAVNPNAGANTPPAQQPAVQPRPNPNPPRPFTRPAPRQDDNRRRDSARTRN